MGLLAAKPRRCNEAVNVGKRRLHDKQEFGPIVLGRTPVCPICVWAPGSVHELASIANVVGQDVLAQPVGRRVERPAAIDL